MKNIIVLILPLITCFELQFHNSSNPNSNTLDLVKQDSIKYKVYKIDSINNYYLIYVKQGRNIFKIVSKKEKIEKCNLIAVDNEYKIHLHSMLSVNGHSIIPPNAINEISGWRVDDSTTINFEGDSIRDLYYADNIKGLCLIKTKMLKNKSKKGD